MRGWSCWVAAIGLVVGCRFGFDPNGHSNNDDASPAIDAVVPDALVGGACAMFTQLALGNESTCMLGANGTRWCAGANVGMGLATPSTLTRANGEQDWTELALGSTQSVGLRGGSLWAWDSQSSPMLVDPAGDWQGLDGQIDAFCARKPDGTLVCGGTTIGGSWISASAGTNAFCGVKADHSLWCWGENLSNVLGQGVEPDGTIHATPAQVGTDNTWKDVQVATGLACARKTDNTMWCWGGPNYTGTGFNDTLGVPTQTSGRTNWIAYWVRWHHGCAMKDTHDVECWGTDEFGLEVVANQSTVGGSTGLGTSWDDFRSGGHHYCGQKGGLWYCWGNNDQGQLGIGTHVTQRAQTAPLCSN